MDRSLWFDPELEGALFCGDPGKASITRDQQLPLSLHL